MTKLVEYNDVYALTFVLVESDKDGESKLEIGLVHQDEPVFLRFNFKYLTDLIGASIDAGHRYPPGTTTRGDNL